MHFLHNILGLDAEHLNAYQMSVRTIVVFFAALLYVRIAGIRTFGKKTTFDQITALIIGTLMGNAIFNAHAPFFPLLLASLLFMVLHRLMAWVTFTNHRIGNLLKGKPISLIKEGKLQERNLERTLVTKEDIEECLRLSNGKTKIEEIKESYLERSGDVSFIKQEEVRH